MKFPNPIPIKAIADRFQLKIIGDDELWAHGINEIHKVETGDITFSDVPKYFKKSIASEATIIILNEEAECPEGKALLIGEDPFFVYNTLVTDYRPFLPLHNRISPSAEIGENTIIEPGVIVGNYAKIGKNCYIQANAYIGDYTIIEDYVEIQAGAIIGTDAFYFKKQKNQYFKWTSGGYVHIGSYSSIGAGCTINKGVSGVTRIGQHCRLDSQVHLGHGAVLGDRCLLAAQVGIGGKTIVGDDVVMYGQVGIAQNLVIGDRVLISAKSGVSKNLKSDAVYFGIPAEEIHAKQRQLAWIRMNTKKKHK